MMMTTRRIIILRKYHHHVTDYYNTNTKKTLLSIQPSKRLLFVTSSSSLLSSSSSSCYNNSSNDCTHNNTNNNNKYQNWHHQNEYIIQSYSSSPLSSSSSSLQQPQQRRWMSQHSSKDHNTNRSTSDSTNDSNNKINSTTVVAKNNKTATAVAATTTAAAAAALIGCYYGGSSLCRYDKSQQELRSISTTTSCQQQQNESSQHNQQHSTSSHKKLLTRNEQLKQLMEANSIENSYDILIVGGGVTGCGIALDSVSRGLKTACIEKNDFGNETSSRSTKLIWAGIRYIATAISSLLRFHNITRPVTAVNDFISEFKMVLGAHKERRILLHNNPHLTYWVPIAIPINNWFIWPPPFGHPLFSLAPITLPLVMKFYDSLSNFTCPPSHIMSRSRAIRKFPQLSQNVKYFQIFYEGQHNDSRTNTVLALTASEYNANIINYIEMIDVIYDPILTNKAIGIKCRNNASTNKEEFNVYSKAIIFAGGPFTDSLRIMDEKSDTYKPAVKAAAGTHIILPGYYCPGGMGMLDINTSDGRFLFFLPWEGYTLVGTTDRKDTVSSNHGPPEVEIQWLLNEVTKYLATDTGIKVRRSDVLSAWQGYRPLASDPNALPGAPISRDHIISTNPISGITFITGGKWVTYREMAQDTIDKVLLLHPTLQPKATSSCQTENIILRGGINYHRNLSIELVQKYNGLSHKVAEHLTRTYGTYAYDVCQLAIELHNEQHKHHTKKNTNNNDDNTIDWPKDTTGKLLLNGYPYLECEIIYQCRNEMLITVSDMISLRFRLAYLNKNDTLSIVHKVTDIMSKELKWSTFENNIQYNNAIQLINSFGGPIPNTNDYEKIDNNDNDNKDIGERIKLSIDKLGKHGTTQSRGSGFG